MAAILAADIAGYSALMGADEEATVSDLKAHQAIILPMVGEHGGRIIDTAGDGILAEFASVLAAVKCALAMQRTMAERNAGVDPIRRMQFRIGINQGDVVFDDARVYGDGVNIAARLESIANPGGICISAKVHDEISGRMEIASEDLGPQHLKNIAPPVRVYRIDPSPLGGLPEEALHCFEQAMRMNPRDPPGLLAVSIASAHYLAGRYIEAVRWAQQGLQRRPEHLPGHRVLCACLAQAGQIEEAKAAMRRLRQLHPEISIAWYKQSVPYKAKPMEHFLDGLRKAGLPEG